MSEVSSADWTRLTHYLEARFPELKDNKQVTDQTELREGAAATAKIADASFSDVSQMEAQP